MAFFEISRISPLEAIASKYNQFKQVSKPSRVGLHDILIVSYMQRKMKIMKIYSYVNRDGETNRVEKSPKRSSVLFTIKL